MGIKHQSKADKISRKEISDFEKCSAEKLTIVFSFKHMTKCDDYNFRYFNKRKKNAEISNAIVALTEKLSSLSCKTWDDFRNERREVGFEYIPITQMEQSFITGIDIQMSYDEKLISVRFNGQNSRLILRRGTKCRRVAHLLGIDYDLKLYKH